MTQQLDGETRRGFIRYSSSCATHLAMAAVAVPPFLREWWGRESLGTVVAREPFGSLERVAEGIWALISTPLSGDRTTLSNGGLIAGRDGVLAIEGFMMPAGATWLAGKSRELTGKWPSHVVLTHYHADHANGVAGYKQDAAPSAVHATEATRDLVLQKNLPAEPRRSETLSAAVLLPAAQPISIDLGGRTVRVIPRDGHTTSDVTVEVDDPSVVFCGDLVWNAMFPNYVDARPLQLAASVASLRRTCDTIYVPGHGALAREADLARYVAMLGEVEQAARRARAQGIDAATAAASFTLSPSLGEWMLFSKVFFERAFAAWYREPG